MKVNNYLKNKRIVIKMVWEIEVISDSLFPLYKTIPFYRRHVFPL